MSYLSPCKRKRRYAILLCSKPFLFLLQPKSEAVRTQAGGVCLDRSPQTACGSGSCLLSGSSHAIFPLARAPPFHHHPLFESADSWLNPYAPSSSTDGSSTAT